jgi:lipid-binding SYLF domain-containing protein
VYTSLPQEQHDSISDLKHESNDFKSDKRSKSKSKSKSTSKSKKNKQEFNSEKLPEYSADAAYANTEQLLPRPTTNAPKLPRVLLKIPPSVIQDALGLAIFTVARAGTWGASLACGSGVLIARKLDNTWSSPSGIIVNTLGVGFLTGIDVYDCVVVINTHAALEKFKTTRVSLGGEVSVTAGPWGAGRNVEVALGKGKLQPVFTCIKSRGLYVGMQMDGTVIGVRGDENARFYGERVGVDGVLSGSVGRWTGLEEVVGDIERGLWTEK